MQVEFFGAAGEVTGSCHLVHVAGKRVLLDCGMVQGGREEHKRNAAQFAFDARSLDAMVLSHAHIDHVGRLPLLSKRGYHGPIYTQHATAALSRVMLEDAARLAIGDAESENRWRMRRGLKPLQPTYDERDVERVLKQIVAIDYDRELGILPGVRVRLRDAGHILGAAIVELFGDENGRARKLVFSGDIGPDDAPMLRDPTPIADADLVMLESTYGDRLHRPRTETVAELGAIFAAAARDRGMVLIPAFAVGRSQEILYWMARHFDDWGLSRFKIVLDSPMAAKVLSLYDRNVALFDEKTRRAWNREPHPLKLPNLRVVVEPGESRVLNEQRGGTIIIAGSGMCNGGRIKHHLKHHLWRESTHLIFAGYQAAGTLGRRLVDGADVVRIFGESIKVAAQRHTIGGLSAHADQAGLVKWYGHFTRRPPVYLVHGEDRARTALAEKLAQQFGAKVTLATPRMTAEV
jgi:metallo-beta-lactamase family protein